LNMCANNYLGLANHPEVVQAAHEALDHWGNGLASVRFICGTQEPHKALERAISEFLGTEDTILYSSCWDANGGLFETILGPEDAVISDELNHASIIDGIRLCKARRVRYKNNNMADLEAELQDSGRRPGWRDGRRLAGERCVRNRLLLSRRPPRQGASPHAGLGDPQPRGSGIRERPVHQGAR
jgi:7-keto-8-aminopelargonate synthetase-like enzyme